MEISLHELRQVTKLAIDQLINDGRVSFPLEYDYYWHFFAPECFDMMKAPVGLGCGQLYDDLHSIRDVLSGEMEPMGCALWQVAPLLRLLGEVSSGLIPATPPNHSSTTPSAQVSLQELLLVTEVALTHLAEDEEDKIESFVVEHDHFWDFSAKDRYNILADPAPPEVRGFTQDIKAIRDILSGQQPVTGLALVQVAPLLHLLGETHSW